MAYRSRISTRKANGQPPAWAGTLYPGTVMHARLRPFSHRFRYRVFTLLVDLDRLEELDQCTKILSVNRTNLVSFYEKDHTDNTEIPLRTYADRILEKAGLKRPAARILLLTYPRVLGYVFNPLSVYFAYDSDDELIAAVYEVRNTFGERHTYACKVEHGELSEAGLRQSRNKLFHVSPFIGLKARYDFRILPPGDNIRLRIHESEGGKPLLSATFSGAAKPLATGALAACLVKIPLMTWKIILAIHFEALKLWAKGAKFHRSPPAPPPVSYRDKATVIEPAERQAI